MATSITIRDYLDKSELKLRAFKREWESFKSQVPKKLEDIIASSLTPTFSINFSGDQISSSIRFESNPDAAKQFGRELRDIVDQKSAEQGDQIEDIDNKLQMYHDQGVDRATLMQLIKHLNAWIDYTPEMSFSLYEYNFTFSISAEMKAIKEKWARFSTEDVTKRETETYDVAPADLEKHRVYLNAKSKQRSARTSEDMKQAESMFIFLKDYLDSEKLAKACATSVRGLKAKEERTARIVKEGKEARARREEALKQEEKQRFQMAVETYKKQVEDTQKAREFFIASEKERLAKNIRNTLAALQSTYDKNSRKKRKAIEAATAEKNKLEQELAAAGLFALASKKKLRADIKAVDEKISLLSIECQEMEANLKAEKAKQQNAYETALAAVPANAEAKYVMPDDPRKS